MEAKELHNLSISIYRIMLPMILVLFVYQSSNLEFSLIKLDLTKLGQLMRISPSGHFVITQSALDFSDLELSYSRFSLNVAYFQLFFSVCYLVTQIFPFYINLKARKMEGVLMKIKWRDLVESEPYDVDIALAFYRNRVICCTILVFAIGYLTFGWAKLYGIAHSMSTVFDSIPNSGQTFQNCRLLILNDLAFMKGNSIFLMISTFILLLLLSWSFGQYLSCKLAIRRRGLVNFV